jgi:hypothetical protein
MGNAPDPANTANTSATKGKGYLTLEVAEAPDSKLVFDKLEVFREKQILNNYCNYRGFSFITTIIFSFYF